MKVLIICNSATGLLTFRGMLISKLIEKNNSVQIILPDTDVEIEQNAEMKTEQLGCKLIRIPMERRGMNPVHDIKLLISYYKAVKEINPDMVITYTIKPNIYGGFVCRLLKVPYAANITGLGSAFNGNGLLKRIVTVMYKIAFKKVHTVFFENTENRDTVVDLGIIKSDKVCVLAGAGVDINHFSYSEYPEKGENTRFLFMGRIMREKGMDELLEAIKTLNNEGYKSTLDILGEFEEDYADRLKEYEQRGLIHYYGYQEDVRPFINKCNCFVLPSWHEGMANTNLEAAAVGRPVITSNIPGCKEAVEDGVTGYLCEAGNSNSLYKVMKKICELSYDELKSMGIAGRKRMEENFDKRKVVEETMKALNLGAVR